MVNFFFGIIFVLLASFILSVKTKRNPQDSFESITYSVLPSANSSIPVDVTGGI